MVLKGKWVMMLWGVSLILKGLGEGQGRLLDKERNRVKVKFAKYAECQRVSYSWNAHQIVCGCGAEIKYDSLFYYKSDVSQFLCYYKTDTTFCFSPSISIFYNIDERPCLNVWFCINLSRSTKNKCEIRINVSDVVWRMVYMKSNESDWIEDQMFYQIDSCILVNKTQYDKCMIKVLHEYCNVDDDLYMKQCLLEFSSYLYLNYLLYKTRAQEWNSIAYSHMMHVSDTIASIYQGILGDAEHVDIPSSAIKEIEQLVKQNRCTFTFY